MCMCACTYACIRSLLYGMFVLFVTVYISYIAVCLLFLLLLFYTLYSIGGHGSMFDTFLVEYLRDRYIETTYIPEGREWPPNQPKYYVNLAVIRYQGSRTQEEVIFRTQHHQHIDLAIDKNLYTSNQQLKFSNRFRVI